MRISGPAAALSALLVFSGVTVPDAAEPRTRVAKLKTTIFDEFVGKAISSQAHFGGVKANGPEYKEKILAYFNQFRCGAITDDAIRLIEKLGYKVSVRVMDGSSYVDDEWRPYVRRHADKNLVLMLRPIDIRAEGQGLIHPYQEYRPSYVSPFNLILGRIFIDVRNIAARQANLLSDPLAILQETLAGMEEEIDPEESEVWWELHKKDVEDTLRRYGKELSKNIAYLRELKSFLGYIPEVEYEGRLTTPEAGPQCG